MNDNWNINSLWMKQLSQQQAALATAMSEISERCYGAGWMQNLEYRLWAAITEGPQKYGQDFITSEDIDILTSLSREACSWIIFDPLNEETPLPIEEWQKKYTIELMQDPLILRG